MAGPDVEQGVRQIQFNGPPCDTMQGAIETSIHADGPTIRI